MPMTALYPIVNRAVTALSPNILVPDVTEVTAEIALQGIVQEAPPAWLTEITTNTYRAKMATIVVSLLLAFFIFLWSRDLYGPYAGLLAATLYLLDPNIIGHSRVVNLNILEFTAIFVSIYYFWRLLHFGGGTNLVASIVTCGIAQITRITALYLAPIYLILAFIYYRGRLMDLVRARDYRGIILNLTRASSYAFLLLAFSVLLLTLVFLLKNRLLSWTTINFKVVLFKLQSLTSPYLPIPLPYAYMVDLDFGKYKQETGAGSGLPYLMGELAKNNSHFDYYYLLVFLYKVPIATQVLIFIALLKLFHRRCLREFSENEAFLLVPPIIFLLVMSTTNAQLGVRY